MQNVVSETLGRSVSDRMVDSVFTAGLTILSYLALGPIKGWVIAHPVRAIVVGAFGYVVAVAGWRGTLISTSRRLWNERAP
jgi:hypothetical protein